MRQKDWTVLNPIGILNLFGTRSKMVAEISTNIEIGKFLFTRAPDSASLRCAARVHASGKQKKKLK
jgi:hypothetical protein